MTVLGLIPARVGSKRIPGKNFKWLGGKPLIQWTLDAARASGVFEAIAISSETSDLPIDEPYVAIVRPAAFARDDSPDIEWVRHALDCLTGFDAFAILRPTSPFRTSETIRRAWAQFLDCQPCDSLRAVEPARQHPGKMWEILEDGRLMRPLLSARWTSAAPWHSSPTQVLPPVYAQNASLEIAWTRVGHEGTIAGTHITPFHTDGWEGFDLNTPDDWARAEAHVAEIQALAGVSPDPSTE